MGLWMVECLVLIVWSFRPWVRSILGVLESLETR